MLAPTKSRRASERTPSGGFVEDMLLRLHGYRIAYRKGNAMALWLDRMGRLINQRDALAVVRQKHKESSRKER